MGTQHRGPRDSTLRSTEHLLHSTSPNTHAVQPRDPELITLLRDGLSQDSLLQQEDWHRAQFSAQEKLQRSARRVFPTLGSLLGYRECTSFNLPKEMNSEPLSNLSPQQNAFPGWQAELRLGVHSLPTIYKSPVGEEGEEGPRLPRKLAGDERGLSLGQVLRGGDVVAGHQVLVCSRARQLLVLHLGFGHVVVS